MTKKDAFFLLAPCVAWVAVAITAWKGSDIVSHVHEADKEYAERREGYMDDLRNGTLIATPQMIEELRRMHSLVIAESKVNEDIGEFIGWFVGVAAGGLVVQAASFMHFKKRLGGVSQESTKPE